MFNIGDVVRIRPEEEQSYDTYGRVGINVEMESAFGMEAIVESVFERDWGVIYTLTVPGFEFSTSFKWAGEMLESSDGIVIVKPSFIEEYLLEIYDIKDEPLTMVV